MARQGTSNFNRYTNWEFPEYEFQEFPKLVYPGATDPSRPTYDAKGRPSEGVLVNDEAEEATVLAGKTVIREEDERADLIGQATARNMQFDKRWGVDRLRNAIQAHDAAMAAAKRATSDPRPQL